MSTTAMLNPSEGIALITDGSADHRDRSGGWAWIAVDAFEGMEQDSGGAADTTIGRMELIAPIMGLVHLRTKYGPCEVLVYSDAEYVVLGAMERARARNANRELWFWLDDLMDDHTYVEFLHVRGHEGHIWNEMADKMAGKARKGVS